MADVRLAASDFFLIMRAMPVTRCLDSIRRHPVNEGIHTEVFCLSGASTNSLLCSFPMAQLHINTTRLMFHSRSLMLTAFTPLTCAVAAGSPEWVQYLASCHVNMALHWATAAEVIHCTNNHLQHHQYKAIPHRKMINWRYPQRKAHHRDRLPTILTSGTQHHTMDALVLSVAVLAEADYRRITTRCFQQTKLCERLVSIPPTLRREKVNLISTVVAGLRHSPLLKTVMTHAAKLRDTPADGRYLSLVLEHEVPQVLRSALGTARHVMHAVASCGDKELLLASNAEAALRSGAYMTAAMLAAVAGHDHLAASVVHNFSYAEDWVSARTSIWHCAAMGDCVKTLGALIASGQQGTPLAMCTGCTCVCVHRR